MTLTRRARAILGSAAVTVLVVVAIGYVLAAGRTSAQTGSSVATTASGVPSSPSGSGSGAVTSPGATSGGAAFGIRPEDDLLFVNKVPGLAYGRLALTSSANVEGTRQQSDLDCARVYAAADRVLCLRATGQLAPAYQAVIMDRHFTVQRTIDVAGLPSRARLSADGKIGSWTVFVSGDSYLSVGFSTRTSVIDLRTGVVVDSLEIFTIIKDGKPYTSSDVNFWGVTVADDDRHFYATMATQGQTYLVRGDLVTHQVSTITTNVECPSLSPDNTRIVFKKRVDADGGRKPWLLWVLDLHTMTQTPLTEQQSVDDQAVWLDNRTIAYALPVVGTSTYDVWSVPADGTGTAHKLVSGASSPTPLTH